MGSVLTVWVGVPRFLVSFVAELHLGKVLGRGGFSVVVDITKLPTRLHDRAFRDTVDNMYHHPNVGSGRVDSWWRRTSHAPQNRQRYFVLKCLKPVGQSSDARLYVQAVVDILMEARYLSILNHPHILQLRGMVVDTRPESLILEKLVEGLEERLHFWKKKNKSWRRNGHFRARAHWDERVRVASHIASAVSYLHEHSIVFRDIKPDNVGKSPKHCGRFLGVLVTC